MKRFITYFIDNRHLTNWLMILIFASGTFGLLNLQKRIWPKIEFDYISIHVTWSGASALEIEENIVRPLEEGLMGLEGIVNISATSRDNSAWFGLETSPWYPMDTLMEKVRSTVETLPDYPEEAERPVIVHETEWNRVMLLFMYGAEDLRVLEQAAEEFREELIRSGQITQILTWGFPSEQIIIEVKPRGLERHSISLDEIDTAVRASSLDLTAGSILTADEQIQIRTYEKKTTIPELEKIVVKVSEGRSVRIGDVCTIRRGRAENAVYTRMNGEPAIGFHIMYSNTEDVIGIARLVDRQLEEYRSRYEGILTYRVAIRDVEELNERLNTLMVSGIGGLLLVLLVLGLFLNRRVSFWVAMGIPISFMGLLFLEWTMDMTINEMSLFGMIVIVGILVDDGIVIGESIYDHWKRLGKERRQAAIEGTLDVLPPVLVSLATTIAAFAPYFFIYGDMGKYVRQIGIVVVVSLSFSIIEAVILLPAHLSHSRALSEEARRPNRVRRSLERAQDFLINRIYAPFLDFALQNRALILSVAAGAILISVGAVAGNHIKAAFFPELVSPYVYAEIEFPAGTNAEVVNRVGREFEVRARDFGREWAQSDPDHENAILDYLCWGDSSHLVLYLLLIGNDERDYSVNEFANAFARALPDIPETESVIIGKDTFFGGDPISFRFLGKEEGQLEKAAELFKKALREIEGIKDIRDDMPLGQKEFLIHLNRRGQALGLHTATVANQVRMGFYGSELFEVREGRRSIPVVLRLPLTERNSVGRIEDFPIHTPGGGIVPFREIADFQLRQGIQQIRRENGYRSIRVMAGIDSNIADLNTVLKEINEDILPRVLAQVDGVSLSKAGQAEMVNRMMKSMLFSMAMALLIMFTLLLFQMKTWSEPLLVLSLIPLGFLGALYGHMIMGAEVSFISFLGSVALAGIIVNDSVVLIDCFNKKLNSGMPRVAAIREAALQRFRPIIMTTITTAVGLSPLILQKSVGGQMLVPIGISIAYGLIFGTFITLAILPVVLTMIGKKS
ncbi:efflux RND transporter permease subunit [Marispirochaeta aestuarii]|uniref:efflux RND transporter permease subunit n=1 Tax=Marispirochaeta aestuarii TaxID=1963862 RepID=UPI002ABE9F6A|nr:efflux RND transporter permease subunit [Marispirochaeta aestuarii]